MALEEARNPEQLQRVEFGRGYNYKLPLRIGMASAGSTILKEIVRLENALKVYKSSRDTRRLSNSAPLP